MVLSKEQRTDRQASEQAWHFTFLTFPPHGSSVMIVGHIAGEGI